MIPLNTRKKSRVLKLIETEKQNGGCPGLGEEWMSLMGTEFQFCQMRKFWRLSERY